MQDVIDFLFATKQMMPHGSCFLWDPALLWLMVIANLVTALSYFSIPLALGFFVYKRNDITFKWMLLLFSVFIFACGITHVLSIVTIWHPVYGLSAMAEAFTALVSLVTAVMLWPLIPKALRVPSPSSLLQANKKLEDEVRYHKETKAQLSQLNAELDRLVELKTQELQASEQRFRTIFEQAPLGIAVVNPLTGHFQDINPKFEEIVGRGKDELIGSDWMGITHPEDIEENSAKNALLNAQKITDFKITKRYIRPDNTIVWVKLSCVPLKAGPLSRHQLRMVEDITESKLTEQKNLQLGNILEQSTNEIYIINGKTLHFELVNQGGLKNLGYSLNELKSMTPLDIKADCDFVSFNELIKPLLHGEQQQVIFEAVHQRKNGTCYPVEVCLQLYRNNPDYFVSICLDISGRKSIERDLLDERNLLLSLINNIPDYIFYKNTAGEYLLCNKAVANYFNQPVENIIGHTDYDFVDPITAEMFRQQDAAMLAQGMPRVNEESITLPDGKQLLLETLKTPFKNSEGHLLGLIGIGHDITQRKAQEEKITRLSNFYACLSKINHAIVQINNEADLFAAVCTVTASLHHVKLAWIGRPDASLLIVPVAAAGERQDYLANLVISVDPDVPAGQGPSGVAYRENRIVAVNDFQTNSSTSLWHDNPERSFSWGASCSVPVVLNQQPYVVLNVYSNLKDFFDGEVLKLMAELSLDLSFALDSYTHEAARKIAEEQLVLSAKVFSQSQEAIIITDKNNEILSVNRAFTIVTGYEEQEVLGKNPKVLASDRQDKEFYRAMWESLLTDNFWQGELWNRHKDGTVFPEWLTISVVCNECGEIIHYIATFTDISQHKAAEQHIEHLAHYDSLTNLANRLLLKSRMDYEIIVAERHKKSFALLFIDLDHFKNINDSLGHSIGDQVLIEVGRRLLACVREEDTVARLGGDEFVVLLADTHWNGAAVVANKVISLLSDTIFYHNYQLHITPSIGISLYPDNGESYETLFKNADTALYQAKENGRNQYQFFTSAMQQQTQRRMAIENCLRQAIPRNELKVYFQPQVDTQTGQINGAEALLRWQHPDWGMVAPVEFIPIAEECGLILAIGDWVLEHAVAQARQWHDAGFPLTIAVNLSLAQFRADTLYEKVKQTLECHHLPPQYLELELTESIAMQNAPMAVEITHQLTELGVKLSIDDFGTGYSSLSYLQQFSLHKLKIDQSFTLNMVSNKDSENIVDAIIGLAKSLNLKTIAEGVETEQQLDMFKQKHCDGIQGYYFSAPVSADKFIALVARQAQSHK